VGRRFFYSVGEFLCLLFKRPALGRADTVEVFLPNVLKKKKWPREHKLLLIIIINNNNNNKNHSAVYKYIPLDNCDKSLRISASLFSNLC
jgi:hypothetical protein